MTPIYPNSQALEFHHEDHQHEHDVLMISPKNQASTSSTCPSFFNSNTALGHHETDISITSLESYDHLSTEKEKEKYGFKLSIWKTKYNKSGYQSEQYQENKEVAPFETYENNYNNDNISIKVCSDCHTTKTPLWRSGPRGPKSLCNACGIRQRKARRAIAAAAAVENGTNIHATAKISHVKTKVQQKEKKKLIISKKKQLAISISPSCSGSTTTTRRSDQKLCFEEFTLSLIEKYSAFQHVFPQDEKEEAAMLLMELSFGRLVS